MKLCNNCMTGTWDIRDIWDILSRMSQTGTWDTPRRGVPNVPGMSRANVPGWREGKVREVVKEKLTPEMRALVVAL